MSLVSQVIVGPAWVLKLIVDFIVWVTKAFDAVVGKIGRTLIHAMLDDDKEELDDWESAMRDAAKTPHEAYDAINEVSQYVMTALYDNWVFK
jgi:uncharacterized protein YecA (UPF0149 family)